MRDAVAQEQHRRRQMTRDRGRCNGALMSDSKQTTELIVQEEHEGWD